MPLGLMTGMRYDERETMLLPGDSLLFYSEGLVEAHDPERAMFGFPRLMTLLGAHADGTPPIMFLLRELADFTGAGWEQEDDITLVTLQRLQPDEGEGTPMPGDISAPLAGALPGDVADDEAAWCSLDQWTMPSESGNERLPIQRLAEAVRGLDMAPRRLEQLQTALGEATLSAMEHGDQQRPELPVSTQVLASLSAVAVRITDQGGYIPLPSAPAPDLDAKLAGDQSPRRVAGACF
jgi:anti-sigma regulatory factor (Ser/Thr protein kinase)